MKKFTDIKLIKRHRSIVTGKNTLKKLYTFNNFPVFMGCVNSNKNKDLTIDMDWDICTESGVIQLKRLLPLDILYQNQHNDGTGTLWQEHYLAFSKFISQFNPKHVLEIGGAHDAVAKNCFDIIPNVKWTVVEPNPKYIRDERITRIKSWFNEDFVFHDNCDCIVHSHVFEHMYDPVSFIKHIGRILKPRQKHIFSFPNMEKMLRSKFTNCLNFEHTIYLTESITDYILQRNDFNIIDKYYFGDHSIFYATEKSEKTKNIKYKSSFKENLSTFTNFIDYHKDLVANINKQLNLSNDEIYMFGAHIFSQFLLNFGLYSKNIVGILDNSSLKQGKRLYGTNFRVFSPEILKYKKRCSVILKVGIYRDEILAQLKGINSDIKIIE